jgi:exosortase/archaeosortase
MTASNYISHISGIMDAVHAHLKFKLSALIIALPTVMNNFSHHQVIPVEMDSLCFKHIKGKLHYTKQVG